MKYQYTSKFIEEQLSDELDKVIRANIEKYTGEGWEVVDTMINIKPMHDLYHNQAPQVCNNWVSYSALITFKRKRYE